jgi:hypothetical protein
LIWEILKYTLLSIWALPAFVPALEFTLKRWDQTASTDRWVITPICFGIGIVGGLLWPIMLFVLDEKQSERYWKGDWGD